MRKSALKGHDKIYVHIFERFGSVV